MSKEPINQTTSKESSAEKFAGLSNEEILVIHTRFKQYLDTLNESFEKGQASKQIDTPLGKATAIVKVDKEQIEKFKATEYYQLCTAVVEKLSPIVELLQECDENYKKLADELR